MPMIAIKRLLYTLHFELTYPHPLPYSETRFWADKFTHIHVDLSTYMIDPNIEVTINHLQYDLHL